MVRTQTNTYCCNVSINSRNRSSHGHTNRLPVYIRGVDTFANHLGYSRVFPGLLAPVTSMYELHFIPAEYLGPGIYTRWFAFDIQEMATCHPLNHAPWVVFRACSPGNPIQAENILQFVVRVDVLIANIRRYSHAALYSNWL